jgi:glycosyltransferase involved in cell wall biosynthesis
MKGPAEPRVTVLVMTYNHERFIRQAIDSALMQRTEFDYEILISEDYSTDSTRQIVHEYAARHPHVRLILSDQNLHCNEVVARGIRDARGEFVALLDGDDCWLSAEKLQKQVDFLDAHPECTLCFHQALVRDDIDGTPDWYWTPAHQREFSTLEDIWMGNFIATCSTMFRRYALTPLPDWYSTFPVTDWPLHILNAEKGNIGYINEVMGLYRYHTGGAYSGFSETRKQDETWRLYELFNPLFGYRYDRLIKAGIFDYFLDWAEEYIGRGEQQRAVRCFHRGITGRPLHAFAGYRKLLRIWLKLKIPVLRTHAPR